MSLIDMMRLFDENVPVPPSPEQPPLAPYDPPAPAPQANAWRRAMKVVMLRSAAQKAGMAASGAAMAATSRHAGPGWSRAASPTGGR